MSSQELSLIDAFKVRRSSKNYGGDSFPPEKMEIVRRVIEEVNNLQTPFRMETKVTLHEPGLARMHSVANETGWLLGQIKADIPKDQIRQAQTDVAYRIQHAVMKLTQNKINTGWVGGTFNRSKAEKSCPGWSVPVVVAFGEERDQSFFWKALRSFGTSEKRKPLDKLFYDNKTNKPIKEDAAGDMLEILKALQSGPSALNEQGWRFVVDGPNIHLFDANGNSYSPFDNGIAAANMHMLGQLRGHGEITVHNPPPPPSPLKGTYICTGRVA